MHRSDPSRAGLATGPVADPRVVKLDALPSGSVKIDAPGPGVDVLVHVLDDALPLPGYAHPGDAGADLCTTVDVAIGPGERVMVPTGVAIALPDGYAAFVHPRSGLANRFGVGIVNAPGTIDAGYRGEIKVLLINHDPREPAVFRRGDRIAQLVIQRVERARFHPVERLPGSVRGAGGHGSTGGFERRDTDRCSTERTQIVGAADAGEV